jgi:NAD(P)H-dependent flavin oxidoreductase YrpB (nitropropane dioxygenase family)
MDVTTKMLAAAVKKADELGLLPMAEWTLERVEENWRRIRQVLEAALAAADDVPESRLDRARAAYDALREALEAEHGRALEAERERDAALLVLGRQTYTAPHRDLIAWNNGNGPDPRDKTDAEWIGIGRLRLEAASL